MASTKMADPKGSTLLYSTYFGGSNEENGIDGMGAIGVDSLGFIYVGGRTASINFPAVNALQPAYGGGPFDNFAAKFSPDGSALIYSTSTMPPTYSDLAATSPRPLSDNL